MDDQVARSWLDEGRTSGGDRLAKSIALGSAAFLISLFSFLAGLWFQDKRPWPHEHVYEAISTLVRAVKQGTILPKNILVEPLGPPTRSAFAPEPGVAVAPGYRAVMGYLPELKSYGIRVVAFEALTKPGSATLGQLAEAAGVQNREALLAQTPRLRGAGSRPRTETSLPHELVREGRDIYAELRARSF